MIVNHQGDYRAQRAKAYPPVGDQLDAIWKALSALDAKGIDLGAEAIKMLGQIEEVKRKRPKP